MQEIVAETQAKRNNRENESHFRKQPADHNSPPVDPCATHFSIPVPPVELPAIISIRDERKSVVKSPQIFWQYFPVRAPRSHGSGRPASAAPRRMTILELFIFSTL